VFKTQISHLNRAAKITRRFEPGLNFLDVEKWLKHEKGEKKIQISTTKIPH
jgi:hypothetical protein